MRRHKLMVVLVVCLSALAAAALAGCETSDTPGGDSGGPGGDMMGDASPSSSPGGMMNGASPSSSSGGVSRGEAIFKSGTDANGDLIPRSSNGGSMMGGGMMGGGCATCHGADGRGRTTAAFTAPDITYGNLTDPQGMLEPDGDRGHTFTDAGIKTAVIEGLDPEGSRLEAPMPQWHLNEAQWSDLLAYLKTLR